MNRRKFLTVGASAALVSMGGCAGFPRGDSAPEYPGGSLYLYNTSRSAQTVVVTTIDHSPPKTFETTVPAGETVVQPEFVSAPPGTVVTIAARIGEDGEQKPFEFLPSGGGDGSDAPPEYARFTITNAVEASAEWTAREGT